METTTLKITQGCDKSWPITLNDPSTGNPITTYTTANTPSAKVWTGLQEDVVFAPSLTWVDPSQGTLTLSITASQTAALSPGRYKLGLYVSDGSGSLVDVAQGGVYLLIEGASGNPPTPGTAIYSMGPYAVYALPEYSLTDIYPTLDDEFTDKDLTGFARQLGLAREWIDRVILAHDTGGNWVIMADGGYSPVGGYWGGGLGAHTTNVWLRDQLKANTLMVTPLLARIINYYALSLILEASIGPDDKESAYERKSRSYLAKAEELTATYVAELDLNADGYPDYWVDCGTISTRSNRGGGGCI